MTDLGAADVGDYRYDMADAVAGGRLTLPVQRTYPLGEVPAALSDFALRGTLGKLAIEID